LAIQLGIKIKKGRPTIKNHRVDQSKKAGKIVEPGGKRLYSLVIGGRAKGGVKAHSHNDLKI